MELVLGVENVAYADPDEKGVTTTQAVARILEKRYHVMRVFYELHESEIQKAIAEDLANHVLEGAPNRFPLGTSMGKIETAFRQYLDADEWQKTSGQVIAAAQNGVSHRFKNAMNTRRQLVGGGPHGKGGKMRMRKGPQRGARPAFIDTGLYQASFRAYIR